MNAKMNPMMCFFAAGLPPLDELIQLLLSLCPMVTPADEGFPRGRVGELRLALNTCLRVELETEEK
jgi:hypothetical protein